MTRVMFLGDTHGDLYFLEEALATACGSCDAVFQLGDFGFLWPKHDNMDEVESLVEQYEIPLFWIDGNHDWHPEIRKRYMSKNFNHSGRCADVYHVRRGCTVKLGRGEDMLTIAGLGGAPSIDQAFRKPGKSWWPEETIEPSDLLSLPDSVDVLATHDAPSMPPGFLLTEMASFNEVSEHNRSYIRQAISKTCPSLVVHGHWHKRYSLPATRLCPPVEGLHCNQGPANQAYLVVEKKSGKLTWQ